MHANDATVTQPQPRSGCAITTLQLQDADLNINPSDKLIAQPLD